MQTKIGDDSGIVPEEPESSNPQEREARRAKNRRYNAGGPDLTVERPPDSEIFFRQVWPAVDFIPVSDSAVVVTGRVLKVQPYLSSDRSRIYTEITVEVDDLLKRDRNNRLSAAHTVVIDRLGGALKMTTGNRCSERYVFFAQR